MRTQRPCAITADTESKKPEKRVKDTPAGSSLCSELPRGYLENWERGEKRRSVLVGLDDRLDQTIAFDRKVLIDLGDLVEGVFLIEQRRGIQLSFGDQLHQISILAGRLRRRISR